MLVNELTWDRTVLATDCEGDLHLPVIRHGPQTVEWFAVALHGCPCVGNHQVSVDQDFRGFWESQMTSGNILERWTFFFTELPIVHINKIRCDSYFSYMFVRKKEKQSKRWTCPIPGYLHPIPGHFRPILGHFCPGPGYHCPVPVYRTNCSTQNSTLRHIFLTLIYHEDGVSNIHGV